MSSAALIIRESDATASAPVTAVELQALFGELKHPDMLQRFSAVMASNYPSADQFPYHNLSSHIIPTLEPLSRLVQRAREAGYSVDADVMIGALLGHDSGYDLKPQDFGFGSKEELSGELSSRTARTLGASDEFIKKMVGAIHATHFSVSPTTVEEKLMRAADLSGLNGRHEDFRAASLSLHTEYKHSRGTDTPFAEFYRWQVEVILAEYLIESIALTAHATDNAGRSLWHAGAVENIARCMNEGPSVLMAGFNPQLTPMVRALDVDLPSWAVGIAAPKDTREQLGAVRNWATGHDGLKPVPLVLPGSPSAIPVPSGFTKEAHVLYNPLNFSWNEMQRVADPAGTIAIYVRNELHDRFGRELFDIHARYATAGTPLHMETKQGSGFQIYAFRGYNRGEQGNTSWQESSQPDNPNFSPRV